MSKTVNSTNIGTKWRGVKPDNRKKRNVKDKKGK
jgi:hypothetical protein